MATKKLIEVALPLEAINETSAREKSIRHGHPSTLHLWWARRPLAAARAVIWASLVDDPSSHPEEFSTEEAQNIERERLFDILERLVVWENSNNPQVLEEAKAEIMKSTNGHPPALLDPFAGGGAIPLEAQRLGLEAHAHDLNPVAVMINKAMIEIPPKFANAVPVNPDAKSRSNLETWQGAQGLAEDVCYYGEWMKQEAFKRIGHLYPKVKVPQEQGGGEATVIAWIWARTVKCPNPACGCEMPLFHSCYLSKNKKKEIWHESCFEGDKPIFHVRYHGNPKVASTVNRKGAICAKCGTPVEFSYIRSEGKDKHMGAVLCAIVAEGASGRLYLDATDAHVNASQIESPIEIPDAILPNNTRDFKTPNYGMRLYSDLFTNRQLVALTTFSDLVAEVQQKVEADAITSGMLNDGMPLSEGGTGAKAYGEAIGVYLAFIVDKMTDYHSSICSWHNSRELIRNTFGRQAIPMVWDYAEANPFSHSSGCFDNMLEWVYKCIVELPASSAGLTRQFDAQSDCGLRNIMISSDPPYYDNIGYADLSDYFYVWLRRSLKSTYPKLFGTMLVPKAEELVATPYRFGGSKAKAKDFFEDGMLHTCQQLYQYAREDVPVTIYYAYKQSDTDAKDTEKKVASTGWETMLSAIIQAGFVITGTWPVRTEMANRSIASGTNALASSIVLVCRKRGEEVQVCTRRSFINELKRELRPALQKLQASNIAPVDLAQSSIGPGMAVFSKYAQVLEADGSPMTVRSALQIINQELDVYFNEQDGALDKDSRFCVELYTQYAFNDVRFGEADVLARAKNTSVDMLAAKKILFAEKGIVRLYGREDLPQKINENESVIWILTQQLAHAMETGGIQACAEIVAPMFGANAEQAKALAYRLYTIAERKGWAQEAHAYNALVVAWPDIQSRAAMLQKDEPEQQTMF